VNEKITIECIGEYIYTDEDRINFFHKHTENCKLCKGQVLEWKKIKKTLNAESINI